MKRIRAAIIVVTLLAVCGCDNSTKCECRHATVLRDATNVVFRSETIRSALRSHLNTDSAYDDKNDICLRLTLQKDVQRYLHETLVRYSGTNSDVVGMGVVLNLKKKAAVVAIADCGVNTNVSPLACSLEYEPGAVIMPITAALAFERDIVQPHTNINTDRHEERYYKLPGDAGRNWPSVMSISDAIIHSSNICIGKIGHDLGADTLHTGLTAFGFGKDTDLNYPDERKGFLCRSNRIDKASRSRIPIGMNFTATLLQIARAYAILANDGDYVEPYIVSDVKIQGVWRGFKPNPDTHNVISSKSARFVNDILRQIPVEEGPVKNAAIKGLEIAGKSGTALWRKGFYEYDSEKYSSTFVGFFPSCAPKYLVAVSYIAKRETGNMLHCGSGRAAIAFSRIAKYLLSSKEDVTK